MLFIDTNNYYNVVDRTLNEWGDWQLKNLNAIVWLYRGEIEKYQALIGEYHRTITKYVENDTELLSTMHLGQGFDRAVVDLRTYIKTQKTKVQREIEAANQREKKKIQMAWDKRIAWLEELLTIATEAD